MNFVFDLHNVPTNDEGHDLIGQCYRKERIIKVLLRNVYKHFNHEQCFEKFMGYIVPLIIEHEVIHQMLYDSYMEILYEAFVAEEDIINEIQGNKIDIEIGCVF